MGIQFLAPGFLLLLLVIPLFWWLPRPLADWRVVLRSLVIAGLALGLARPISFAEENTEYMVFLIDHSPSVTPERRDAADAAVIRLLDELPSRTETSAVVFGEDSPTPVVDSRLTSTTRIAGGGSSISAALHAALRLIPDSSRGAVTLISDGAATDRRWGPAAQALAARGIPVHVAALDSARGDVFPVVLRSRDALRVGQTAVLLCDVVGEGAEIEARLLGPSGELDRVSGLRVDGRTTALFEFEPEAAGYLPLTVEITASPDLRSDNNSLSRTFAVQDPLEVLYIGDRVTGGGDRLRELLGSGFEINEIRLDAAAERDLLAQNDLVFVDDRPADTMPSGLQEQLVDQVTNRGLGLIVAGGKAAFGPGGYHGTVLAEALPVEAVQKEEKRDPSTTLVIIIDTSGSMGGMRVTLAKEVARLAMRRLLPHDKVGIVEFYGAKRWAAPIQPASNLIELQRALNRLDSGGGTVILPAIEEAFYAMQNVETRYKHVVILTDGGVETGAFEPLLRQMTDKGINTSTVLVGPDAHSDFLVTLANWGKGRFYSVPNRFNLPEIILKQPASAQLPAYRPGEHPVSARGGHGWWGDTDPESVPPIAGYVETRSRPGAQILLETDTGSYPVMASWRYGLGRVTTLSTEPTGPGTSFWQDWAGYGPWLARVLTRTARDSRARFEFTVERRGAELFVTAERRETDDVRPRANVFSPDEPEPRQVTFAERAPGHFTATIVQAPDEEARLVAGTEGRPEEPEVRLVSSAGDDLSGELQVDPQRALDLVGLAEATGGNQLPLASASVADLTTGGGRGAVAAIALWPWCLLLALIAYLGELFYRRLPTQRVV